MGEYLAEHEEFVLEIPMGQITITHCSPRWGPTIPVHVRVVGNPGVDYGRSFEDAGINEINHRIWIQMELVIQVTHTTSHRCTHFNYAIYPCRPNHVR